MTRLNHQSLGSLRRTSSNVAWILLSIQAGCSLKSLDDLQSGEPNDSIAAAGSASGGSGGRAGLGGSSASGDAFVAAGASNQARPTGGNLGSGLGGNSSDGGVTATNHVAGTSAMSNGGAHRGSGGTDTGMGGSRDAFAGAGEGTAGGISATTTGGLSSSGGFNGTGGYPFAGAMAAAGHAGSILHAGSPNAAGMGANAGAVGATAGGTRAMTYNVTGQSCANELTCPTGVSCCTQIEIPAATFIMGTNSDASRNSDESPQHNATVDRFTMDKFEVTVGRFRSFAQVYDGTMPTVGAGARPKDANSGWLVGFEANMPASSGALRSAINCSAGQYQTWTEVPGVRETMPMNCVSWYVAFAFCIWDGGRLPTEAEWEMAASSGTNEWRFPWGANDPNPTTHANMNCLGDGTSGCAPSDLLPVGSRTTGANQWGHLDLAGSLWEWVLDYYDNTYYQSIGACNGCANIAGSTPRVIRGGGFTSTLAALRATGRASKTPITVDPYAGFRCVRSL